MPLINHTFFSGDISIPNVDNPAVYEALTNFVARYEEKFLVELFGYNFYREMILAVNINPLSQKWYDLIYGAEYLYGGIWNRWKGLIQLPAGVTAQIETDNLKTVVVGRSLIYDPIPETDSVILPPSFAGSILKISRRGIGLLTADEFSTEGGIFSLKGGAKFIKDDTYFYEKNASLSITALSNATPYSMIADYIYYWWMENEATNTTGTGESVNKTDNATRVSPAKKMVKAWKQMSDQANECLRFIFYSTNEYPAVNSGLVINSSTYRGFYTDTREVLSRINAFNI